MMSASGIAKDRILGFLFVLIVGLIAGTISGIVGTGSSIMLMPVLIYQYGPKEAVPIMAVAAVMANLSRILAWWREVLDHIAWHEGRHIKIEKSWLKKAPAMFEGKPCTSGQRIATRWAKKVAEAQAAFDAKDYAAYEFPPYDGPGGFFGN